MSIIKKIAPLAPYVGILTGLYILKNAWIALLLYHALIILVLYSEKELSQTLRLLKGGSILSAILISLFGLSAGLLLYFLWPFLGLQETLKNGLTLLGLSGPSFYIWSLYFFLINPFFEEAFWRGYLGTNSKKISSNDVLFSAYHALVLILFMPASWTILAFCCIILASWLWRQVVRKYKGLLLPVLSHLSADISVMAICAIHL
jgi:membrane protease YdiL (CAAX protease family)